MGIPELWEVLKPGFDKRITLEELVDHYVKEYHRPPRVAIDAYMFIFHSDHSSIPSEDKKIILMQNFMSKILALIGLNISVIVVFDGILKPDKTRSGVASDYEKELEKLQRTSTFAEPNEFVEQIKGALQVNKIEYLQAAGEAEAQCAYIQKLGIVDFVISNDVDSLVFGATQVLRNYSRFVEDIGRSPSKKPATLKQKYYVTPVRMKRIEEITGLTRERLVFLATLRGGDYSSGVKRMGIVNATNLALSGTLFGKFYNRSLTKQELKDARSLDSEPSEPPPDFSEELEHCVVDNDFVALRPWDARKDKHTREILLASLLKTLNESLQVSNRDIFGRGVTITEKFTFDEYYVLLYFFPLVQTTLPVFLPWTLSSGELDINLEITLGDVVDEELTRSSEIEDIDFNYDTSLIVQSSEHLFIPQTYNWQIKFIIFKLASYSNLVRITNDKIEDGVEKVMLKYDERDVRNMFPMSLEARRVIESPEKRKNGDTINFIWIPTSLVKMYCQQLLAEYEQSKKDKLSTKNSKSSQKTTLDMLENSPTKGQRPGFELSQPIPFELKPSISPPKRAPSPKGRIKKVSPKKKAALVEGQSKLDCYFKAKSDLSSNPFLDPGL
ncbi:hypothetical protein KGF57_003890 [Candida theae]|uniref:XPG-I domain-containing protein n=1 Tax=Candida theae TaxID=1198502 RepID=A0AAD5BCY4_9ASCO|nr:uncharacterized protein KGF57_003890 [Candida theae]KAI5954865.1 hypothetical protein KGF57_003890 [Candida theae]